MSSIDSGVLRLPRSDFNPKPYELEMPVEAWNWSFFENSFLPAFLGKWEQFSPELELESFSGYDSDEQWANQLLFQAYFARLVSVRLFPSSRFVVSSDCSSWILSSIVKCRDWFCDYKRLVGDSVTFLMAWSAQISPRFTEPVSNEGASHRSLYDVWCVVCGLMDVMRNLYLKRFTTRCFPTTVPENDPLVFQTSECDSSATIILETLQWSWSYASFRALSMNRDVTWEVSTVGEKMQDVKIAGNMCIFSAALDYQGLGCFMC